MGALRVWSVPSLVAWLALGCGGGVQGGAPTPKQLEFYPGESATFLSALACESFAFVSGAACTCDTRIRGAVVRVDAFDPAADMLTCGACAGYGIAARQRSAGVLHLRGEGTITDYAAALASVAFKTTSWAAGTRVAHYNLGHAVYHAATGRFYAYESLPTSGSWLEAQAAAAAPGMDLLGLVGYLATFTAAEEAAVLAHVYEAAGYAGGTDYGSEGQWRWVTGPEGCPTEYDPLAADPHLRSSCDLGLSATAPPSAICSATGCTAGTPFNATTSAQGTPPSNDVTSNFLAITAYPGDWSAFPFDSGVNGYYVEYGGVGTLCVDAATVYKRYVLTARAVDECNATCPTCAGSACTAAGLPCVDMNTTFASTGDWFCETNECLSGCRTCANDTCTAAGQACRDPDVRAGSLSDWLCVCSAPFTAGEAPRAAAVCITNECDEACGACARGACDAAGQACTDPNTLAGSTGDWVCSCTQPFATGSAVAAVASCEIDECAVVGCPTCADTTCGDANQDCVDIDKSVTSLNSWLCVCKDPFTAGSRLGGVAVCRTDECVEGCGTCALGLCIDAKQTCNDPNDAVDSLRDWECACVAPSTGPAVTGGRALCELDECGRTCSTCEGGTCAGGIGMQRCVDPMLEWSKLVNNDWECQCTAPYNGSAIARTADCMVDECVTGCASCANATCTAADQTCRDTHTGPGRFNDWMCECRQPLEGSAYGEAAACVFDECVAGCALCARDACSGAGQRCEDPDTSAGSTRDWTCSCLPPSEGAPQRAGRAQCVLDECTEVCATCANTTCTARGVSCVDVDLTRLGTWECWRTDIPTTLAPPTWVPETMEPVATAAPRRATGAPAEGAAGDDDDDTSWFEEFGLFLLLGIVSLCLSVLIMCLLLRRKRKAHEDEQQHHQQHDHVQLFEAPPLDDDEIAMEEVDAADDPDASRDVDPDASWPLAAGRGAAFTPRDDRSGHLGARDDSGTPLGPYDRRPSTRLSAWPASDAPTPPRRVSRMDPATDASFIAGAAAPGRYNIVRKPSRSNARGLRRHSSAHLSGS